MSATLVYSETQDLEPVTGLSWDKADFAGFQDGDLVVVQISQYNDNNWNLWTGPTGFTLDMAVNGTGVDSKCLFAYKYVADASAEPATWTFDNGYSTLTLGTLTIWRGIDPDNIVDVALVTEVDTAGTEDPADVTTLTDEALIIATFGAVSSARLGTPVMVAPSEMALADSIVHNTGTYVASAIAYLNKETAGLQTISVWDTGQTSTPTFLRTIVFGTLASAAGGIGGNMTLLGC